MYGIITLIHNTEQNLWWIEITYTDATTEAHGPYHNEEIARYYLEHPHKLIRKPAY